MIRTGLQILLAPILFTGLVAFFVTAFIAIVVFDIDRPDDPWGDRIL